LAAHVAGRFLDVTYDDLENASAVLLVGFEAEEESPMVFLRLRKAAFKKATAVFSIAPYRSHGLEKMRGRLIATVPGGEAAVLAALAQGSSDYAPAGIDAGARGAAFAAAVDALSAPGAVIVVGERLAGSPGGFAAAAALAAGTGAKLAWVPRRAGERGAVEAGALPALLPGGRPLADDDARAYVARVWATTISATPGRDTAGIVAAAAASDLGALLVAGVDPADLPDPAAALAALDAAPFVVSLELRPTAVTQRADVVFPVAAAVEKSGTFLDWEGRSRPFDASLRDTGQLLDLQVLNALADELDVHLGLPDIRTARAEIQLLGAHTGPRAANPTATAEPLAQPGEGEAILASWHELLDAGSLQDATPYLAATAKPLRAHISPATAASLGVVDGGLVTVSTDAGSITVPALISAMPDAVVWLPTRSAGSEIHRTLGVAAGAVVRLEGGAA
jgi:NADH-quinone oxidoreductase subunit G